MTHIIFSLSLPLSRSLSLSFWLFSEHPLYSSLLPNFWVRRGYKTEPVLVLTPNLWRDQILIYIYHSWFYQPWHKYGITHLPSTNLFITHPNPLEWFSPLLCKNRPQHGTHWISFALRTVHPEYFKSNKLFIWPPCPIFPPQSLFQLIEFLTSLGLNPIDPPHPLCTHEWLAFLPNWNFS